MAQASWAVKGQHSAQPLGLSLQPFGCMWGEGARRLQVPWATGGWAGQTPRGWGSQVLLQELISDWATVLGQDPFWGTQALPCTELLSAETSLRTGQGPTGRVLCEILQGRGCLTPFSI